MDGFEEAYSEAAAMDLESLCDAMKEMSKLDPKLMAYRKALADQCRQMNNDMLEEFYAYIKKAGSFLKEHPGKDAVEDVLVDRKLYIRNKDGTISKNGLAAWVSCSRSNISKNHRKPKVSGDFMFNLRC